jgi:glutamate-1-semialdehyde 2,1-aminomutase
MHHNPDSNSSCKTSRDLFARAKKSIPGGVNSPARAFRSVGGDPIFIQSGEEAHLYDVDGNKYIDFIGSWGPLILGHRHPVVIEALKVVLTQGTSFGAPTEREVEMAELICEMVPSLDSVRMVNSGTEATMSAIRLARGFTGRDLIVKFIGCYHGHVDSLLVKAGSGVATLGISDSAGVPKGFSETTIPLPFNSIDALEECFAARGEEIAAVILEPVVGNMGCIRPHKGYLETIRSITRQYGSLLIFDEVMTGFRLSTGGAQELFNVQPDLTTLGKVIGAGLPIGAYGGRQDIMQKIAPLGPVYQAGTLSGNPLAVAGGLAMLRFLKDNKSIYKQLEKLGAYLEKGLLRSAQETGMPITINRLGSMLTVFFNKGPVNDFDQASASNTECFGAFFRGMLQQGIYLPCSQFEAAFISGVMQSADITQTINAAHSVFRDLVKQGYTRV